MINFLKNYFMKQILLLLIGLFLSSTVIFATGSPNDNVGYTPNPADSLPDILGDNRADLVFNNLRSQAVLKSTTHQLPEDLEEWEALKKELREKILKNSGIKVDPVSYTHLRAHE